MATPIAGHGSKIKVASNFLGNTNNGTFNRSRTQLDVTSFSDSDMKRILGLKDSPMTVSGYYDTTDTAMAALDTAYGDGADVVMQFLPDGTNGFQVSVKVAEFNIATEVNGLATYTATLVSNSAVTTVP